MDNKYIPSEKQLQAIKRLIDNELTVRCIKVDTVLECIKEGKPELTSTQFQTVPVLHTNIIIVNFGGSFEIDSEQNHCFMFYIPVHARYTGNGTGLFTVSGLMDMSEHGYEGYNGEYRLPKVFDVVVENKVY